MAEGDERKLSWAAAAYYYVVMAGCVAVFLGGAISGVHGLLRAASPEMASNATCLSSPAPRVVDPGSVSDAERRCRLAERDRQVREGSFQGLQGLAMVAAALVVFSWHLRRVRSLELRIRKDR